MGAVEKGRSVIEVEVEAGRVVFGSVLNGTDGIQRFRERIVHVEEQAVPGIVTESQDKGVVVGLVVTIAHEEIKDLQVVVRGQA